MPRKRRLAAATGVVLAFSLALSACTSGAPAPTGATIKIDGVAPLTVQEKATWEAGVPEGSPVVVTSLGVLTYSSEKSSAGTKYAPTLLSPSDGQPRWVGEPVASTSAPRLEWIEQGNARWAVAQTVVGNKTTLTAWNGLASNDKAKIVSQATFEGTKSAPSVAYSRSGILVSGADKGHPAPFIYHPGTGLTTEYGNGPERERQKGTPFAAYGESFLVAFPKGGFSMASASGGWASTSFNPEGAAPNEGTVLARSAGFLVVSWPQLTPRDGSIILAVHSAATGEALADLTVPKTDKAMQDVIAEQTKKQTATATDGNTWLAWGRVVFDLRSQTASLFDLGGGQPAAIVDGLLYVVGAARAIPQPEPGEAAGSGSASPAPLTSTASATGNASNTTPTSDTSAPEGFTGITGVDLTTKQPMSGLPSLYPVGVSSTGQVVLTNTTKTSIFSVGIR